MGVSLSSLTCNNFIAACCWFASSNAAALECSASTPRPYTAACRTSTSSSVAYVKNAGNKTPTYRSDAPSAEQCSIMSSKTQRAATRSVEMAVGWSIAWKAGNSSWSKRGSTDEL